MSTPIRPSATWPIVATYLVLKAGAAIVLIARFAWS